MIPNWRYRNLVSHSEINKAYKELFDNLSKEYHLAVKAVQDSCHHDWTLWEAEWRETCTGNLRCSYEKVCKLCGRLEYRDDKPDVDYIIKEHNVYNSTL